MLQTPLSSPIRTGRLLWLLAVATLWVGCLKEEIPSTEFQPRLIVEGRIEQGGVAEVMLSLNKAFDESFREEELQEIVVRWAKVTVSNSHQSEVLTGRYDPSYPTRFIYQSNEILGEVGESYTLTVEYGGDTWHATTTIPAPHRLEQITATPTCDSLYQIQALLPPDEAGSPMLVECALGEETFFRPALLGILGGDHRGQNRTITINRPLDYTRITRYTTQFRPHEEVRIRLATTSSFGYDYWSQWENNTVNSLNPIFPARMNLPTNLSGGAFGIWCGYGAAYYRIQPPRFPQSE